ncbi:MAG: TIGR03668 family PPOX class F420-dependent oxidoreductase [Chloroflexales bacterium]|nr:TIGR03668 family PPOX class F420-dependent oxidoreductase [Chloroflexales bacterium]
MMDWQRALLEVARVARLATVDAHGQPHVVPIVFALDGERVLTPLVGKPKRVAGGELQRVRNIAANDRVALVVDYYNEDWQQLVWVQLRGRAALLTNGDAYTTGIALLHQKYAQYEHVPLDGRPLIEIVVEQVRGWRATPASER